MSTAPIAALPAWRRGPWRSCRGSRAGTGLQGSRRGGYGSTGKAACLHVADGRAERRLGARRRRRGTLAVTRPRVPDPRGTPSFRLERPDGCAVRVPARGLMLGRSADCDVVLVHPGASQCHALVLPAAEGLRVVALGRNPTNLNGQPLRGAAPAVEGDLLELPRGQLPRAVRGPRGAR